MESVKWHWIDWNISFSINPHPKHWKPLLAWDEVNWDLTINFLFLNFQAFHWEGAPDHEEETV